MQNEVDQYKELLALFIIDLNNMRRKFYATQMSKDLIEVLRFVKQADMPLPDPSNGYHDTDPRLSKVDLNALNRSQSKFQPDNRQSSLKKALFPS